MEGCCHTTPFLPKSSPKIGRWDTPGEDWIVPVRRETGNNQQLKPEPPSLLAVGSTGPYSSAWEPPSEPHGGAKGSCSPPSPTHGYRDSCKITRWDPRLLGSRSIQGETRAFIPVNPCWRSLVWQPRQQSPGDVAGGAEWGCSSRWHHRHEEISAWETTPRFPDDLHPHHV